VVALTSEIGDHFVELLAFEAQLFKLQGLGVALLFELL
jgi:hypothetical protein